MRATQYYIWSFPGRCTWRDSRFGSKVGLQTQRECWAHIFTVNVMRANRVHHATSHKALRSLRCRVQGKLSHFIEHITVSCRMNPVVNFEDFICLPDPLQSAKSKAMQMPMGNPFPDQGICDSDPFSALPTTPNRHAHTASAWTWRAAPYSPNRPFIGKTSGSGRGHRDHRTSWARTDGYRRRGGCGRTGREPA